MAFWNAGSKSPNEREYFHASKDTPQHSFKGDIDGAGPAGRFLPDPKDFVLEQQKFEVEDRRCSNTEKFIWNLTAI